MTKTSYPTSTAPWKKIYPKLYRPHLDTFLADDGLPNAILLEYIPNLEPLRPSNYSKAREDGFLGSLDKINKVLIDHRDPSPHNMMVVKDGLARVVWLDFDRAQAYEHLTPRRQKLIEFEDDLTADLLEGVVSSNWESWWNGKLTHFWLNCRKLALQERIGARYRDISISNHDCQNPARSRLLNLVI